MAAPLTEVAGRLAIGAAPGRLQMAFALAAGERIRRRTRVQGLEGGCLVVQVPDPAWATQLGALAGDLRRRLGRILGPGVVTRLRFEVAPGLEPAPRAPAPPAPPAPTDADRKVARDAGIRDPALAEAIARAVAASRHRG